MVAVRFRSLTRLLAPIPLVLAIVLLASCSGGDTTTTAVSVGSVTSATTVDQTTAANGATTTGETSTTEKDGSLPSTPPSVSQQPGVTSEYTKRLPDLEKAVKANPNDLKALAQLAIGYYQTQAYPKAEEIYKKMLGIKDTAETHNNLGNVYRDWQKTDQAIAQYKKAIELDPALVAPYSNLANFYMMNADIKQATAVAKAGIAKTSGADKQQLQALLDSLK